MKHSELPIGFHPVPNKRIQRALASHVMANVELGMDPKRAEEEARSAVISTLPGPTFTKLRAPRTSKSDNPAYHKLNPARAMAR